MTTDPELRAEANRIKRIRRFPRDAHCETCGGGEHLAWTQDGGIRCYRHIRGDGDATEADHIAGRANFGSLTVRLDANAHRRVTELRSMLGMDDWPPASDGPLVGLAHLLAGFGSVLLVLAEWLLQLADEVRERFEPWFWDGLPVNPLH
ncbi:MAG: hypothetical protein ABI841_02730 [Chloroflexota bacterium]